jgi:hypothetical protein
VAEKSVSNLQFESHRHRLLPWPLFLRRAAVHAGFAGGAIFAAVAIGTIGYRVLAQLPWVDAFLNASMILGGMGPVDVLKTSGAKMFAALYALFSGLFFIAISGLLLAPWLHRILHRIHMDEDDAPTTPSAREEK